ncbi:EmrB/QacA subfamily drug resistance transporter [Friedmanniella endophytica]|uniref:EmrB/QacA subfamily drug resistance transporter n=1 Tax=Microlunatus kandeliicorticis TaxID=1759536 RepID=A0A7W3ITQ8_9ACTN|nr:MFS transporter [Microlunatus kandeliicorticis]MBA8795033.1 EmrB/QacA subfamily drug resistance transporter [Microlunatus kandeliicorticis]
MTGTTVRATPGHSHPGRPQPGRSDPAIEHAGSQGTGLTGRPLVVVALALGAGLLLTELDQSVFAAALPTLVGELGELGQQLWVGTGYVLAGVVLMPVLGRLGDRLGRRPVFVAALLVFVLGSVAGALAPSMPVLIAARLVQGAGGGGLFVLVEAIVADVVPPAPRTLVLSGIGAVFAVAAVVGPVLGGWLTGSVGWRWAFWMNVPLGLAAAALAWRWLPSRRVALAGPPSDGSAPGASDPVGRPRLDLAGAGLLLVAVVAGTLLVVWGGRDGWTAPTTLGPAGLLVVAVVALVPVERRAADPVLPGRLFRRRGYLVAVLAGAVLAVAMFGVIGYLPTYLQLVHGLSPVASGLFLLTLVAGIGGATVLAGRVVSRTGRAAAFPVVGGTLVAVALAAGTRWRVQTDLVVVGACLLVLGVGIGCAWEVLVVLAQDAADRADVGAATAVNGFVRELGVLAGTALVGRLFTAGLVDRLGAIGGLPTELTPASVAGLDPELRARVVAAYHDAFVPTMTWLLPVVLAATVALLWLPRTRLSGRTGPGTAPEAAS